jgi:hypothetical protein
MALFFSVSSRKSLVAGRRFEEKAECALPVTTGNLQLATGVFSSMRGFSASGEFIEGGEVLVFLAVRTLVEEFRIPFAVKRCLQDLELLLWHQVGAADFARIRMFTVSMGNQQLPESRHEALEINS